MSSFSTLAPHKFELLLYALIAIMLILLGNLDYFARQLDLIDVESGQTVVQLSLEYFRDGVSYLDKLKISAVSAVFVFWSFVGIFALTIIHLVYDVYQEVSNDIKVTTKFYHPGNYSNFAFWKGVIVNLAVNLALYIIVLFSGFFISLVLAPTAITAAQEIVSGVTIVGVAVFAISVITLWGGLVILGVGLRLILLRNQFDV
jgi:hypothetical protein